MTAPLLDLADPRLALVDALDAVDESAVSEAIQLLVGEALELNQVIDTCEKDEDRHRFLSQQIDLEDAAEAVADALALIRRVDNYLRDTP